MALDRVPPRAKRFLASSGVYFPSSLPSLWKRIETTLGEDYLGQLLEELDARAAGEGDAGALYDLLFQSPESALVTSYLVSPLLKAWLSFVEGTALPEGDVIDLGCGAGIATLFYATLRPTSRVVGLDSSACAIASARGLAAKLNVTNVEFEQAEIGDQWTPPGTFSTVISTTLLREIEPDFAEDIPTSFSTRQDIEKGLVSGGSALASAAVRSMAPEAAYLSLERLGSPLDLAAWVGSLGSLGVGVDLASSVRLTYAALPGGGGSETLPALVAVRKSHAPSPEDVLGWLLEQTFETVREEMELKRFAPIRLIKGWHLEVLDALGPGSTRLAICSDSANRFLLYLTNSRGFRQVLDISQGDPEILWPKAEAWISAASEDPSVTQMRDLLPSEVLDF